jgi:hypothetical protein
MEIVREARDAFVPSKPYRFARHPEDDLRIEVWRESHRMDLGDAELAMKIAARRSAWRLRREPATGEVVDAEREARTVIAFGAGCDRERGKCKQESMQDNHVGGDQRHNSGANPRDCHRTKLGKKFLGVHVHVLDRGSGSSRRLPGRIMMVPKISAPGRCASWASGQPAVLGEYSREHIKGGVRGV